MRDERGLFLPGESGNPTGKDAAGTPSRGALIHGFYKRRRRTCDACGTEYETRKPTSRFCSDRCRTDHGAWSYPAAHQTNRRVLGFTGE